MHHVFNTDFFRNNMMGPDPILLLDEVVGALNLQPGMRVLDLACGTGLTSMYLAHRFGVEVVAMDLWIAAEDNARRFAQWGLSEQITPLHMDVVDLAQQRPFAPESFDALISIDAYHYFGANSAFFDRCLAPWLKEGAGVAIVIPGLKAPFDAGVPDELAPYWQSEINFFTVDWWRQLWQQSAWLKVERCEESQRNDAAWQHWLESAHPYVARDREMMAAEAGRWFNFTSMTGRIQKSPPVQRVAQLDLPD